MGMLNHIEQDKQLFTFLQGIQAKYPFEREFFATDEEFVSSHLLCDALDVFFKKSSLKLPKQLKALDIGAGPWHYAPALYSFLSNYQGSNEANLEGIDIQGKHYEKEIRQRINSPHIHYHSKDIFAM